MRNRESILKLFADAVAPRPVRWVDHKTTLGDFPGRDWAVEVFDVPWQEKRELHRTLYPLVEDVSEQDGVHITLLMHTPEATTQYYPWARPGYAEPSPSPTNQPRR